MLERLAFRMSPLGSLCAHIYYEDILLDNRGEGSDCAGKIDGWIGLSEMEGRGSCGLRYENSGDHRYIAPNSFLRG